MSPRVKIARKTLEELRPYNKALVARFEKVRKARNREVKNNYGLAPFANRIYNIVREDLMDALLFHLQEVLEGRRRPRGGGKK